MDACPQGKVLKRLRWNIRLKDDGEVKIVSGRTVPVASEAPSAFRLATRGNGEGGSAAARELTLSLAIGAVDYWEVENLDRCVGLFHIVTD